MGHIKLGMVDKAWPRAARRHWVITKAFCAGAEERIAPPLSERVHKLRLKPRSTKYGQLAQGRSLFLIECVSNRGKNPSRSSSSSRQRPPLCLDNSLEGALRLSMHASIAANVRLGGALCLAQRPGYHRVTKHTVGRAPCACALWPNTSGHPEAAGPQPIHPRFALALAARLQTATTLCSVVHTTPTHASRGCGGE